MLSMPKLALFIESDAIAGKFNLIGRSCSVALEYHRLLPVLTNHLKWQAAPLGKNQLYGVLHRDQR